MSESINTSDTSSDNPGEPTLDPAFSAIIKQAFELWFTPEIEKRKAEGRWKDGTHLSIAQVLIGDTETIVRLNEECKFKAEVDPVKPLEVGQAVFSDEIKKFKSITLHEADSNYGHLTLFNLGYPQIIFDFRRNKSSARQLIDLASEFADSAEFSLSKGNHGPFIDAMFTAVELVSKARLITLTMSNTRVDHGVINRKMNFDRKMGNVASDFVDIFNKLFHLRNIARYRPQDNPRLSDPEDALAILRREIDALRASYG